jgi:hypothetical protein
MPASAYVRALEARLDRLESAAAIRACLNRYMVLCDQLDARTPLDELAGLFTADAVWEGVGEKYRDTFGRLTGREAIRAMLARYTVAPPHFALNVHFLTSETIDVHAPDAAAGSWVMLQTSTFASGASHLNAARLAIDFARAEGRWRIAHFRTENLFSRPVDAWNATAALPVPR